VRSDSGISITLSFRFNGYRYAGSHSLVVGDHNYSRSIRVFLAEPNFDLPGACGLRSSSGRSSSKAL
jgi:hypothetical protein